MDGGGGLVVGGGSFLWSLGGVCAGYGFQRSYADMHWPTVSPPLGFDSSQRFNVFFLKASLKR